jgi:hypothetical protein
MILKKNGFHGCLFSVLNVVYLAVEVEEFLIMLR